jgi:2-hydroxymuconate-semialdehyde hydrolase
MAFEQRDIDFEGINVRYWEAGKGKPPLLLLHGSGPGANSLGTWRLVMDPLAERYHVIACDLIGFGQSGRKPEPPYFDYLLWFRQARFVLDLFGAGAVNVIGHSLSGALSLKLAAHDRRVARVLNTGGMGCHVPANPAADLVWTFPETEADIRRVAQVLVYDASLIDDAYVEARKKVLYAGDYQAYFSAMFSGDKQAYRDATILGDEELRNITVPVLLVHGRDDKPTPIETSHTLVKRIPQADLVALGRCGHSVAIEYPEKLIGLATYLFG